MHVMCCVMWCNYVLSYSLFSCFVNLIMNIYYESITLSVVPYVLSQSANRNCHHVEKRLVINLFSFINISVVNILTINIGCLKFSQINNHWLWGCSIKTLVEFFRNSL
jgi:hypothetical protein